MILPNLYGTLLENWKPFLKHKALNESDPERLMLHFHTLFNVYALSDSQWSSLRIILQAVKDILKAYLDCELKVIQH